jgi:hypothetical protein
VVVIRWANGERRSNTYYMNYLQTASSIFTPCEIKQSAVCRRTSLPTYLCGHGVGDLALNTRKNTGADGRRNGKSDEYKVGNLHDAVGLI